MVVHRALTGYRKVRDEGDLDEHADDIELLRSERSSNGYQPLEGNVGNLRPKVASEHRASSTFESFVSGDGRASGPLNLHDNTTPASANRPFLSGWRVGAVMSLVGASLVFGFNLAVTIYVWTGPYQKAGGSIGTLFEGSCTKTRRLNVWIHLIVNVLSTLLLGASNYCMQVLSAPNRDELVRAHGKRIWLHIGVPSLRNLKHIGRSRALLWMILFISSMPLHLLFNSVVFTNLQANEYFVNPITEDWLKTGTVDTSRFVDIPEGPTKDILAGINAPKLSATLVDGKFSNNGSTQASYQKLDAADCFSRYSNQYMSDAGNLYIVHEEPIVWRNLSDWWPEFHLNKSFTWYKDSKTKPITVEDRDSTREASIPFYSTPEVYLSNGWRCPSHTIGSCDVDNQNEVPSDRSQWQPFEASIKYCMAEEVEERCKLQFSFLIAILVVVSNFIKAVCMALTLLMYRKHLPLVTLGDAIAHFLDHPDPETEGQCLFSRHLMESHWTWELTNGAKKDELGVSPERFDPKRRKWETAPSSYRWWATYVLFVAAIIFAIVCMARTVSAMPKDVAKLWKIGFSTITGNNLISITTSLGGGILLANSPQAVLSYLYLAFNALYTNMFVAQEWSTYMENRKPLRVTAPIGQQRTTYWLNVPFRYAIPMTVMSGLFHWLASQSIFLVRITVLDQDTREPYRQIATCGFSALAIILCTVLGTLIAIGGYAIGQFKYAPGMPVASSCSAAISAACHPPPEDTEASIRPVQWGAVTHREQLGDGNPTVGHCSFSSLPVETPRRGCYYA